MKLLQYRIMIRRMMMMLIYRSKKRIFQFIFLSMICFQLVCIILLEYHYYGGVDDGDDTDMMFLPRNYANNTNTMIDVCASSHMDDKIKNNSNNDQYKESDGRSSHSQVAICIRGDDRNVDNAYNLYKTIIEPLDHPDIFAVIHTQDHTNTQSIEEDNNEPLFVRRLKELSKQYPSNQVTGTIHIIDNDYRKYESIEIFHELIQMGMNDTYWQIYATTERIQRLHKFNHWIYIPLYIKYLKENIFKKMIINPKLLFNKTLWSAYIDNYIGVNALGPKYGHGSAFYQYKDLYNCHRLISKYEQQNKFRYRYIIVARSDYWCLGPPLDPSQLLLRHNATNVTTNNNVSSHIMSTTTTPTRIFIPNGEDYEGTNDRLFAMPRQYASYFLTQPYKNFHNNINPDWYSNNMERLINQTLNSIVIQSGRHRRKDDTDSDNDSTGKYEGHDVTTTTKNHSLCPKAEIVRTEGMCFLACHYEGSDTMQSKDSWKSCISAAESSSNKSRLGPGSQYLRTPTTTKNNSILQNDDNYTIGYNGYKYEYEYKAAFDNYIKMKGGGGELNETEDFHSDDI